jgi:hypothetical protein
MESFYFKESFGDSSLPPSSGKSLLSWPQSIELFPISDAVQLSGLSPEDEDGSPLPKMFINVSQSDG